jgi:hypothetical protein
MIMSTVVTATRRRARVSYVTISSLCREGSSLSHSSLLLLTIESVLAPKGKGGVSEKDPRRILLLNVLRRFAHHSLLLLLLLVLR